MNFLRVWCVLQLLDAPCAKGLSSPSSVKVCTSGDYPPLTHFSKESGFEGLAPEVLRHFAASHNYTVDFVLTPWADLTTFLKTRCLLAAGGITWTRDRAEEFLVSVPLEADRKVPIFASRNARHFSRFKDINQEGISIIENHGGTNERYAHKLFEKGLLTKPSLDIIPTNQEAYACLRECSAHPLVMFTDSIEAEFHSGQSGSIFSDKGLHMALPDMPAFDSHKVYLARNTSAGSAILQELNQFLLEIQRDGRYELWKRKAFSSKFSSPPVSCPLKLGSC